MNNREFVTLLGSARHGCFAIAECKSPPDVASGRADARGQSERIVATPQLLPQSCPREAGGSEGLKSGGKNRIMI
jgi:hypothetical protein